jgi:exodeoxyribonuclease-3|tara:strand:- start:19614 stop:20387 length:774 start_codon:yes stop_codon:yes gene_type:complete
MRVISVNTNGIRAAARKGFFDWLALQSADVVCIQETKAQIDQLADPVFHPEGYHCYYFDAEKKGYSGTALYCKKKPKKIISGLGWDPADSQGRYIQADFDGVSVASIYVPSGSSGDEAQARKEVFMTNIMDHFKAMRRKRREFIFCADWNICHREVDIKNWRGNRKNSGFLPHERAWLDSLFDDVGYADAFRVINQEEDQYTWWSNRGQAWAKNVGWRLDYQVVTPGLVDKIQSASIYKDERFSDHAPFIMDYDIDY